MFCTRSKYYLLAKVDKRPKVLINDTIIHQALALKNTEFFDKKKKVSLTLRQLLMASGSIIRIRTKKSRARDDVVPSGSFARFLSSYGTRGQTRREATRRKMIFGV